MKEEFCEVLVNRTSGHVFGDVDLLWPYRNVYLMCTDHRSHFQSFILINEIHKQVVPADSNDRVKEAYERYIKEREEKEMES